MTGRLSIAPMVLVALLISDGALARDGAPHGDRSADVSGSGLGNGRESNSGDARKRASRASHEISRQRDHDRSGVLIESPYSRPEFYYWPYYSFQPYYSSPSTVTPFSPPSYIDQGTVLNMPSFGPNSGDYCSSPAGYYPYVQECPSGWQRINSLPIEQQPGYWYYCTHPSGYYPYNRECSTIWRKVVP
jgi:hypothetical protein